MSMNPNDMPLELRAAESLVRGLRGAQQHAINARAERSVEKFKAELDALRDGAEFPPDDYDLAHAAMVSAFLGLEPARKPVLLEGEAARTFICQTDVRFGEVDERGDCIMPGAFDACLERVKKGD